MNYYLKNWSKAKSQFERAVRLQGDLFEPRYFLADIALKENNTSVAISQGTAARKLWPHHPGPYYVLGRAYDGKGDTKNAIPNYEGVIAFGGEKSPEYAYAVNRLRELKGQ